LVKPREWPIRGLQRREVAIVAARWAFTPAGVGSACEEVGAAESFQRTPAAAGELIGSGPLSSELS
jgi:hypothetical protein